MTASNKDAPKYKPFKPGSIKRRVLPLTKPEFTDAAREVFVFWGEPNAWEEGSKTNVINVMARHPALGKVYNEWGMYFLRSSTLPTRATELIVLRVAWKVKSEYEWHNHVGYALKAGMTLEEIGKIREKIEEGGWNDLDAAVLRSVDELIGKGRVSDKTWKALGKHFDEKQMMDLTFTVGHYVMTSWALSSFGVELEHPDPIGWNLKRASGADPEVTYKPGETEDWIKSRGY